MVYALDANKTNVRNVKRMMGCSKYTCGSCHLFLLPEYEVSGAHGTFWSNWTIPDLTSFKHRHIVKLDQASEDILLKLSSLLRTERSQSFKKMKSEDNPGTLIIEGRTRVHTPELEETFPENDFVESSTPQTQSSRSTPLSSVSGSPFKKAEKRSPS